MVVDACIGVPRPTWSKRPACRQAGTELVEWIGQGRRFRQRQALGRVEQDRPVEPDPRGQREAIFEKRPRRLGEGTVFGHFEIGAKRDFHTSHFRHKHRVARAVVVLRIFRIDPSADLPTARQAAVALRSELVLDFLTYVVQRSRQIDVVVHVFEGGVIQHVSAQHERPLSILHVTVPLHSLHVIPLPCLEHGMRTLVPKMFLHLHL